MDKGQDMARRVAQPHRPENGAGVEHGIALRAGIDGCLVMGRLIATIDGGAFCHHLQPRDGRRVTLELPAPQPRDPVALGHACARKQPVLRFDTDPVTRTIEGRNRLGPHEQGLRGGLHRQVLHVLLLTRADTAIAAHALQFARHRIVHHEADAVAREKAEIHAPFHRLQAGIVLLAGPVLVVAHRQEPFGPGNMKPVFVSENVYTKNFRLLNDAHLKLTVLQPNHDLTMEAIGFNMADKEILVADGLPFQLAYTLETNVFREKETLQLNLKDIREI